jgi:hypothetical protein
MNRRIIVLTKAKLLITVVMLIGVMAPLLMASYRTPVSKVIVEETKLMTYSSQREGVKFAYPSGWSIRTERDYSGGEIIESISFISPDQAAHGFVQVMKLNKPIPEYVSQAEKSMASGFDSMQFRQTVNGDKQGFVLSYKRGVGYERSVAVEYFYKKGEKVYRFAYFYPEIAAEQYQPVFEAMLGSLKLPGKE